MIRDNLYGSKSCCFYYCENFRKCKPVLIIFHHWIQESDNKCTSACAECCSTSHHWHAEVWPRLVWSAPVWATLAGHLSMFSISSESQFIGASRIVLPSTRWTAVCIRLTFPVISACSQPIGVSWSCHDIVAASSDADRSPLQLRWSGTRFQTPFGTQRWASTTSDRH